MLESVVPSVEIGSGADFAAWWLNMGSTVSLREANGSGEVRSVQNTT